MDRNKSATIVCPGCGVEVYLHAGICDLCGKQLPREVSTPSSPRMDSASLSPQHNAWPEALAYMEAMAKRTGILGNNPHEYFLGVARLMREIPVPFRLPGLSPAYVVILYLGARSRAEIGRASAIVEIGETATSAIQASFFDRPASVLAKAFELDVVDLDRLFRERKPDQVSTAMANSRLISVAKSLTISELKRSGLGGLDPFTRAWVTVGASTVTARAF